MGREKSSTCVLKTEGRGNFSILFFSRVGQRARPYPSPRSHPYGVVVEVAGQKVAQHTKREKFILWRTDYSRLHKKKLFCKNRLSNSNRTYVRS